MNNITPDEAYELLKEGVAESIDVRTPEEFLSGHIPSAENINVSDATFSEKVKTLDKGKKYVINCQHGMRSTRAVSLMHELGVTGAMNLAGGIVAWNEAGLPTEK